MKQQTRRRVGGPIRDLAATRVRKCSWWGGSLSTRRPVAAETPAPSGAWKPDARLAAFDHGLRHLDSQPRRVARAPAVRRATRRGRRLIPLLLLLAVAGIASAVVLGALLKGPTQTVGSVVLSFPLTLPASVTTGVATYANVSAAAVPSTLTFSAVYVRLSVVDGGTTPITCGGMLSGNYVTVMESITGGAPWTTLSPFDTNGVACTSTGTSTAYFQSTTLTQTVNSISVTYSFQLTWNSPTPAGSEQLWFQPNK